MFIFINKDFSEISMSARPHSLANCVVDLEMFFFTMNQDLWYLENHHMRRIGRLVEFYARPLLTVSLTDFVTLHCLRINFWFALLIWSFRLLLLNQELKMLSIFYAWIYNLMDTKIISYLKVPSSHGWLQSRECQSCILRCRLRPQGRNRSSVLLEDDHIFNSWEMRVVGIL